MANKKYLDYAGLKRVLAKLLPGARKIWHGESDDWDALATAERDKYDQAEVIDDGNSNLVALSTEVREGDLNPVTSDAVALSNKAISLETLKARHSGFDLKFQYNASGSTWADGTISHFYAIPVYESAASSEYMVFVKGQSTDGVATHLRFSASGAGGNIKECALNAYCAADPGSSIKYVTEQANDIYINGNPAQGAAVHGVLFLQFIN